MKEAELKIGMRVAIYGQSANQQFDNATRNVGIIKSLKDDGAAHVEVATDPGYTYTVHVKQLRRLVQKKRREWWVAPTGNNCRCIASSMGDSCAIEKNCIRVRETKAKP